MERPLLSFAGRVVLTKSVLAAVSNYVMQGVILLGRILNSLDRVCRNFLWGTMAKKKKMHLVGWDKVTKPKEEVELGIPTT